MLRLQEARGNVEQISRQMAAADPEDAEGWHRIMWLRWAALLLRLLQYCLLSLLAGRITACCPCWLGGAGPAFLPSCLRGPPHPCSGLIRRPLYRRPPARSEQYPLVEERLREVGGRVAPVNDGVKALKDLCEYIRNDQVGGWGRGERVCV